IMDIEMPIMNGLDAAKELKDHPCKVIILTTFARAGYFERARKAGVRGYLLKDSPIEELSAAIRSIMNNRRIFAPELVDIMYSEDDLFKNPLTDRESEVLTLVAEGKTTKQVAEELYLSPGTVRNYMSLILDKLQVSNRIEAISLFKEKGWFK
ncbi:MAG TPA: response regulator transcription factor, partial [Virgibacillus sp.]|nr:response regulator transcription factor [Virgibacillus sp.]